MPEAFFAFWYFIFAVIFAWSNLLTQDVSSRSQIIDAVVGRYKETPFAQEPEKVFKDIETPYDLHKWLLYSFIPITFMEIPENGKPYGYCTLSRRCYIDQGACKTDNQCHPDTTCADHRPRTSGQAVLVNGHYWDKEDLATWCEYHGTPVDLTKTSGEPQNCNPAASATDDAIVYPEGVPLQGTEGSTQGPCCWDQNTNSYITVLESLNPNAKGYGHRNNCPSFLPFDINCCAPTHDGPLRPNETAMMKNYSTTTNMPATIGSFNRVVFGRMTMKRYKRVSRSGLFRDVIHSAIAGGSADAISYNYPNSDDIEDKSTFEANGMTYTWSEGKSFSRAGGYIMTLPQPFQSPVWETFVQNLKRDGWFDRRMASFVLDMLFYNGNKDTFLYVAFIVEFDFTGTATTMINPRLMNFKANEWKGEYVLPRSVEVVLMVLVAILIMVEFSRIYDTSLKSYFSQPIRIFDIFSLMLCTSVLAMSFGVLYSEKYARWSFMKFDTMHSDDQIKEVDYVVDLMYVVSVQQFVVAVNLFMIFIRGVMLVTALDGKLGLIVQAVKNVCSQLAWFCLIFLTLVSGFVGFAYVSFGNLPQETGMFDLLTTFYVIFTMLVGSPKYEGLAAADPELAPWFFIVFYSVLLFVMINMFVSILLSGYDQADYDLHENKNVEMNVVVKFASELKTEVLQKSLYQCKYCFQNLWYACVKPCLWAFFSCCHGPMRQCGKSISGFFSAIYYTTKDKYDKWHKINVSEKAFKTNIKAAQNMLKKGKLHDKRLNDSGDLDSQITLQVEIKNLEGALDKALGKQEEFRQRVAQIEEKNKKKASFATMKATVQSDMDPSELEPYSDSITDLRQADVKLEYHIRQLTKARKWDVCFILLFWLTYLSMMILMNRAEVSFSLSESTTEAILTTRWVSPEFPLRKMDFHSIRDFEDVGKWAKMALVKLYQVPVCNTVSGQKVGIGNYNVTPDEIVTYRGSCSPTSCGGADSWLRWKVNYGTEDFNVTSEFEAVDLVTGHRSELSFVIWSGRRKHLISIYGSGLGTNYTYRREGDIRLHSDVSFPGAGQIQAGSLHKLTVRRTDDQITINLDGTDATHEKLTIFDSVTHVGWQPGRNTIKVQTLSDEFAANWRRLATSTERWCPSSETPVQLLQTINQWNIGFLNTTFVRITVQPACFHNNTDPRWRPAASYLRSAEEKEACADQDCFVKAWEKNKEKGWKCYTSDGEIIEADSGVMKNSLDATAPYTPTQKGKLGPYWKLGGLVFNLGISLDDCVRTLQDMDIDGWFSKNSASIVFDWITYNGNFDVFTYQTVSFSLLPTGKLQVGQRSYAISLNVVEGGSWYRDSRITVIILFSVYALAVVVYLFLLVRNLSEQRRFCRAKGEHGLSFLISYYSDFWNIADTFSLALSSVFIALYIEYLTYSFRIRYNFTTSPDHRYTVPRGHEAEYGLEKTTGTGRVIQDDWYAFSQVENIVGKYYFLLNTAALNSLFISLRVLQNVNKRPEFAVFAATLHTGAAMNIYFFIVIGLVFVGWTLFFTVLFGHVDNKLSSLITSLGTMFEWMLGSFDNTVMLEYSPLLTIFCFVCFQIIMKFVAINMFLATMLNTYSETVGSVEVNRVQMLVDKEKTQVFKEVTYKTRKEFEDDVHISRDDKGELTVTEVTMDGIAATAKVEAGHVVYSINYEKDEWKLFSSVQEIKEESITPGRDNQIHITFKDEKKYEKSGLGSYLKRSLKRLGEDGVATGAGGPRPTVKNFWRRHGAVTTVSNDVVKLEAMKAEARNSATESESREGVQGMKALDDDEDDDPLAKENSNNHTDDKTSRGRVKKRLEGLLFSRAADVSRGSDPFDIAHDGLVAQDFTPADDGKMYQDCELDELRTRIEKEQVTGWEVWLDCLMTQIEREPEMDIDSIFTEVLRTAEMRDLRKGTPDSSNVLRDFWTNASDILSILEHKAKKRYYSELQHESSERKKVLEEQNKCLHDYACSLEDEFEGLMMNVYTVEEKRDMMKQKLFELIGHDKLAAGRGTHASAKASPRVNLTPRSNQHESPRYTPRFNQSMTGGNLTRPESDFEQQTWNYSAGKTHTWSWANGRWPGRDPDPPQIEDQTEV